MCAAPLIDADFNGGLEGFDYLDDLFRDTDQPAFADGGRVTSGGEGNTPALRMELGGINGDDVFDPGMSGGFEASFTLTQATELNLRFFYRLDMSGSYEDDEFSEVLVSLTNGTTELFGRDGNEFVARLTGDAGKATPRVVSQDTVSLDLGIQEAGTYTLTLGGRNNKKTTASENTLITFDDVLLQDPSGGPPNTAPMITSLATATAAENQTAAIDIDATDDNDSEGLGLTYSLTGGADAALFGIDADTGEITFNAAPDFEAPADANADNDYEVEVTVTDLGGLTDVQDITVTVTNEDENAVPSMATGVNGYTVTPILTVGETLDSTGALNDLNEPEDGYAPPGILDGLGAFALDDATVRVFANHELRNDRSYEYEVSDGQGGTFFLIGARISYLDIDKESKQIVDSGLAYDTIVDANGDLAGGVGFLVNDHAGFSRFCSGILHEGGEFGENRGIVDTIYFAGEEDGGESIPIGGAEWALDVSTGTLHQIPAMGRGAWENTTQIDSGTTTHVAFILSDDTSPFDTDGDEENEAAPLYLYVGEKDASDPSDFLARNGLKDGKLYVWASDTGETLPSEFNGAGSQRTGTWVAIDNNQILAEASEDGSTGFDAYGYPTQRNLWTQAEAAGAFGFSRPEDVATNPADGTEFVLASTGVDTYDVDPVTDNGADTFGTMYTMKVDFSDIENPAGQLNILYDGDQDPSRALRSPDNLDWADDGFIYVQEDEAEEDTASGDEVLFGQAAANPNEAGIIRLDAPTGETFRVANIDRSTLLDPTTSGTPVDRDADPFGFPNGEWESSGILDVSALFGETPGTLFLFDVQAHGLKDQQQFNPASRLNNGDLVEGGQLLFLKAPGPIDNTAPVITSLGAASVAENQTAVIDVEANDDNDTEGSGLTYAITGGVDASLFGIDAATGEVTFDAAPDFEAPGDADGDNDYEVQVTVTDTGGLTDAQDITVSVTDAVENTGPTIIDADFSDGLDGFGYVDDAFGNTAQPDYADGGRVTSGGAGGSPALRMELGGIDGDDIGDPGMSGGFETSFTLGEATEVNLNFFYRLDMSGSYEADEFAEVLVSLSNGSTTTLFRRNGNDFIDRLVGDAGKATPRVVSEDTVSLDLGALAAGTYTVTLGGRNNKKTTANENTVITFDDVLVEGTLAGPPNTPPVAQDDAFTTDEDTALSGENVLDDNGDGPDSDDDGDTLTVTAVDGQAGDVGQAVNVISAGGRTGQVTIAATGDFSFDPQGNFEDLGQGDNDTVTVDYTLSDGNTGTDTATVSITVDGVNDAPTPSANNGATVGTGSSAAITAARLAFADVDNTAAELSYAVTAGPANGQLELTGDPGVAITSFTQADLDAGQVVYVHGGGSDTADSFTFSVNDGDGGSVTGQTFDITVSNTIPPIIDANFSGGLDGFGYVDDAFGSTAQPDYADGGRVTSGGADGSPALRMELGGIDGDDIGDPGMSGGFETSFTLDQATNVTLNFFYRLDMSGGYEADEFAEVLVSLNNGSTTTLVRRNGNDFIDRLVGDAGKATPRVVSQDTVSLDLGLQEAGTYTVIVGGRNNKKTTANENTVITFDDVLVEGTPSTSIAASLFGSNFDDELEPLLASTETLGAGTDIFIA